MGFLGECWSTDVRAASEGWHLAARLIQEEQRARTAQAAAELEGSAHLHSSGAAMH